MAIDKEAAITAAEDLFDAVSSLAKELRHNRLDNALAEFETVKSKYPVLATAMGEDGERVEFGGLMRSIGASLVEAQRGLDRESERYTGGAFGRGGQATAYRIPRLKADLKFALEKVKGKEVNLLIYRQSEEAKELHQQAVEFEIAAVPPSADALRWIQQQAPRAEPVLAPAHREDILDKLDKTDVLSGPSRVALKEAPDRVVLLRELRPHADALVQTDELVYVVYVQEPSEDQRRLGAWTLTIPASGEPSAQKIRTLGRIGENLVPLHKEISTFADRQAAFLAALAIGDA